MENKDVYFVAVKIFFLDLKGSFLIIKDRFGDWDIPGGRLRENDFETPLETVAERKIKEELGENVKYKFSKQPILFMRHERDEILPSGEREKRRIFALGYIAKYEGGEIKIGKNHEKYEWVPVKDFKPKEYFTGGWLKGVQDFQAGYEEFLKL